MSSTCIFKFPLTPTDGFDPSVPVVSRLLNASAVSKRFGGNAGRYLTRGGTTLPEVSLPCYRHSATDVVNPRHYFHERVVGPAKVGIVAPITGCSIGLPACNPPGKGHQYLLSVPIQSLLSSGDLTELIPLGLGQLLHPVSGVILDELTAPTP